MTRTNHAIRLRREIVGWSWELIAFDGVTAANGAADHQVGAMESAWRAARDLPKLAADAYPEIYLNHD